MELDIINLPAVIWRYLLTIQLTDVLDIAIMAFVLYKLLKLVQSTKSASLLKGLCVFMIALFLSYVLQLHSIYYLMSRMVDMGILALIILFQPEIRRILEQMGSRRIIAFFTHTETGNTLEQTIGQTVLACTEMSHSRTGALIVFERDTKLGEIAKSGTLVNADPTRELIGNVFFNKAPLHDGAMIIRDGMIHAAGCILPLTKNTSVSAELGTRHRAALGVSEESDAVVVVVSEETGQISVAVNGVLARRFTRDTLRDVLEGYLIPQEEASTVRRKFDVLKSKRTVKK